MQTFQAYYRSLDTADQLAKGVFEFESDARLGSKANQHDARLKMLELFGSEAVSWVIEKVEKKKQSSEVVDGQLALDFREPVTKSRRKKKKEWW